MSTYAIGDIQGCFDELQQLLETIAYDSAEDELWLLGDLINRGPKNASVMDLLMGMDRVKVVLGNHDLHFLAIATGQQTLKSSDTIQDLLTSPKRDTYIDWLRQQPLIHQDAERNLVMVHAGLPPQWSLAQCLARAHEVESVLRTDGYQDFLKAMYGNEPDIFDERLEGMARLRVITNCLTRLRYCTQEGRLELKHKAEIPPEGFAPWFSFPRQDDVRVLFGHWAALEGKANASFVRALDTGCVWGRELTALRLEDDVRFSVAAST